MFFVVFVYEYLFISITLSFFYTYITFQCSDFTLFNILSYCDSLLRTQMGLVNFVSFFHLPVMWLRYVWFFFYYHFIQRSLCLIISISSSLINIPLLVVLLIFLLFSVFFFITPIGFQKENKWIVTSMRIIFACLFVCVYARSISSCSRIQTS